MSSLSTRTSCMWMAFVFGTTEYRRVEPRGDARGDDARLPDALELTTTTLRGALLAVHPIRILGDPALRRKAKRVPSALLRAGPKIDASIHRLIEDMIDSMHAA